MTRGLYAFAGGAVLAVLWLGPLPALASASFSAHMLLHMGVVAAAAPLLALAASGTRFDLSHRWPVAFNPLLASVAELLVVWGWHAPSFHHGARTSAGWLAAEQGSFLVAGLWLWMAACGGATADPRRAWAGMAALLFTSIHMTLLGAVFALAPRAVYAAGHHAALDDQHLGGTVMLLVGGASYLSGGLWLAWCGLAARVGAGRAL